MEYLNYYLLTTVQELHRSLYLYFIDIMKYDTFKSNTFVRKGFTINSTNFVNAISTSTNGRDSFTDINCISLIILSYVEV